MIEDYVRNKNYPEDISEKDNKNKPNFRKALQSYWNLKF